METIIEKKIYEEIANLKRQTDILKKLVIFSLKDAEGDYKESFVKKVIKKSKKNPELKFINKKEFLKQIS